MGVASPITTNTMPLVGSSYSPGGAMTPTAQNNFNNTPTSYSTNPYMSGSVVNNQVQSQTPDPMGGIINNNAASIGKAAGNYLNSGTLLPQSSFINGIGGSLGFGTVGAPVATLPGGATTAVSFGADAAAPVAGMSVSGTTAEVGALGTSATLSSVLGAAGIGAFAGSFLGKIGGNSTNGSIGGGVGAGIGMAVGGPIGAVVGGLIGGIGGGFFGPGKPTAASQASWKTDEAGNISLVEYGEKNAGGYSGFNQQLNTTVTSAYNSAKDYLATQGIKLKSDSNFGGGVNTRHSPGNSPGFMNLNGKVFDFDPNNKSSIDSAVGQSMIYLAKQSGASDDQVKEMLATLTKKQEALSSPANINIPTNTSSSSFADYVNNYKNSLNPQGNTNATTPTTTG